jgi:hypothetical protein
MNGVRGMADKLETSPQGIYRDGTYYTDKVFRPYQYTIDKLLPENLILLSGDQKTGKTTFVMQMCEAITRGNKLFGKLQAAQGRCLCVLYEQNDRAVFRYLETYDIDRSKFRVLHSTDYDIDNGLREEILRHCSDFNDTVLIVVDTLDYARGNPNGKSYDYSSDRRMMTKFHDLANEAERIVGHSLTLLIVTHNRKEGDDCAAKCISGTQALIGTTEGNIIMRLDTHDESIKVFCSPRYFPMTAFQMKRDNTGHYFLVGDTEKLETKDTPLTISLARFMDGKHEWSGTSSELQHLLRDFDFVANITPAVFGKILEEDKLTLLSLHGINISKQSKNIKQQDGSFKTSRIIYLIKSKADSQS